MELIPKKLRLNLKSRLFFQKKAPWLVVFLGFLVYFLQAFHYALTQRSIVDEGIYLVKGLFFARGIYTPFQEYGFWTQKAPLVYLFYGWAQQVFSPGLRTGRFFSIIIGSLAILGFFLTIRRLRGTWWGVAALWVVVVNSVTIRYFSSALSQSLVVCLLMWSIQLAWGRECPRWQILAGSLLAGIMVMARQNMAPVLLILAGYLVCRHGWKTGLLSILVGFLPALILHIIYWPGILTLWTPWLPENLTPFLDHWRIPLKDLATSLSPGFENRLQSFLEGLRFHYVALLAGVVSLFTWSRKKIEKAGLPFQDTLFIQILFLVLMVFHLWAGLGNAAANNNNVFTFNPYLAFFDFLGLISFACTAPALLDRPSSVQKVLIVSTLLVTVVAIGYGNFEVLGNNLANTLVPRTRLFFSTWKFLPGKAVLWEVLENNYGIPYQASRHWLPTLALAVAGLFLVLVSLGLWLFLKRKRIPGSFPVILLLVFLIVGGVYTPTPILSGGFRDWNCQGNVITTYEQAGQYLAGILPDDSLVYWDGGNAVAVLAYLPGIRIFPPQLDGSWNYLESVDTDTLARMGFWNVELKNEWQEQADVILLQQQGYASWKNYVNNDNFNEPLRQEYTVNCESDSYLRIFIRDR